MKPAPTSQPSVDDLLDGYIKRFDQTYEERKSKRGESEQDRAAAIDEIIEAAECAGLFKKGDDKRAWFSAAVKRKDKHLAISKNEAENLHILLGCSAVDMFKHMDSKEIPHDRAAHLYRDAKAAAKATQGDAWEAAILPYLGVMIDQYLAADITGFSKNGFQIRKGFVMDFSRVNPPGYPRIPAEKIPVLVAGSQHRRASYSKQSRLANAVAAAKTRRTGGVVHPRVKQKKCLRPAEKPEWTAVAALVKTEFERRTANAVGLTVDIARDLVMDCLDTFIGMFETQVKAAAQTNTTIPSNRQADVEAACKVLMIHPPASSFEAVDEIIAKAAYLRLSKQCHPDKIGGSTKEQTDINAAWATIKRFNLELQ